MTTSYRDHESTRHFVSLCYTHVSNMLANVKAKRKVTGRTRISTDRRIDSDPDIPPSPKLRSGRKMIEESSIHNRLLTVTSLKQCRYDVKLYQINQQATNFNRSAV